MVTRLIEVRQVGQPALRVVVFQPLEIGRDCSGLLVRDTATSRRHVRLTPDRTGLLVDDLGSSNGTWVNDRRIETTTHVGQNDTLRIGDTAILIGPAGPPDSSASTLPDLTDTSQPGSIVQLLHALTPADLAPPRAPAADGIVTIFFSDIEGSTDLVNQLGDHAWLRLLNEHNTIIRRSIRAHGGTEVKTIGDGFMVTFPSAAAGLQGAIAVQRAIADRAAASEPWPIRVRIGLHAGEVLRSDGDVFGAHVNIAARVAGQAVGDEILVSGLLHDLVRPVTDVLFSVPRELALKGFAGSHRVHTVRWQADDSSSVRTCAI